MAPSRRSGRLLALLLGVALPGPAQGLLCLPDPARPLENGAWQAQAAAFGCSDPVPIHGLLNRWQGGFEARSAPLAYGTWGLRSSAGVGAWQVEVWDLTSFLGRMSPDGARLLWLTRQRQTLPGGETFAIDLELDALHRDGVSLGRGWRLGALTLGAELSLWTATGAQFGQAHGVAAVTGPKSYSFDVDVDYAYNQNRLYTLPVPAERGWGAGLDLGAAWTRGAWEARLALRDLGNQTRWDRLPLTTATAVSKRNHTDAGGYLLFDPTIEGWEGERPRTWREPVAWSAALSRALPGWTGALRLERIGPLTLGSLEARRPLAPNLEGTCGYELRKRLWSAGLASRRFWLNLGLASLNSDRTRALRLDLGVRGRW